VDIQEVTTLKKFEYKVPGGKLIRVKVEISSGRISFIQITGDFFMEPETDLEELELKLINFKAEPAFITPNVLSFFTSHRTVITGATAKDFAYTINQAITAGTLV
jgi:lipoate-protein ligase A